MKKPLKTLVLPLVLAICLLASACSGAASSQSAAVSAPASELVASEAASAAPAASGADRTVTDMLGRTVELNGPVERVVALTPAECEILFALGVGEKLVGRGAYCDYPVEALDIPSVGSGSETNVEQILALEPDVVLMSSMDQSLAHTQQLEASGVPVVTSESTDIEGVYTSIELMGEVMGLEDEAAQLVAGMKADFEKLAGRVPQSDEKSLIYFEVSPLEYGLWTAGKDTFMDEIATMLGAENCFADTNGWVEISEEQVLERNPDYIVTITMFLESGMAPTDEIMGRPGWENITAVQQEQVFEIGADELSRPGPRLVQGAQILYEKMYGAPAGADASASQP